VFVTQLKLAEDLHTDVASVGRIEAVPTILDVVCRTTGMRFAAVARVTPERWVACGVLDQIEFGLKPGDELKVETTICHEIRQSGEPVIINHVSEDAAWCQHATPLMYGFQSYISMPIVLSDGSFFGTLCAIDPRPALLNTPEIVGMFRLFAELIAKHLDAARKLAATESALLEERAVSELREQFIAVLGHDLRTPTRAITSLAGLLLMSPLDEEAAATARMMRNSALRMNTLIENMLDLARGQHGGLPLHFSGAQALDPALQNVIAELRTGHPKREIQVDFDFSEPFVCDPARIAQLLSNLLGNALSYGAENHPVRVSAKTAHGTFELSVANQGEPIPAAALERLFQPFYRSSVRGNRDGLGLGLFIAYEIAKAHSGTIEVHSTAAETRFTFRMPSNLA